MRSNQLRCVVISPNPDIAAELADRLQSDPAVKVVQTLKHYPSPAVLEEVVGATLPNVVFVSTDVLENCVRTLTALEEIDRHVTTVAIGKFVDADSLTAILETRVREFLAFPFPARYVRGCVQRLRAEHYPILPEAASYPRHNVSYGLHLTT